MRSLFRSMTIAGALVAIVASQGTARAGPVYEWQYSVDGGAFTNRPLSDPNNNSDSVSLLGGNLTISINTSSNNPGDSSGAELFNATTGVVNSSGSTHTIVVNVTETDYSAPTGMAELTADVGPVTVRRVTGGTGATATGTFSGLAYVSNTNTPFGGGISTNVYSASGSAPGGSVSLANATLTNGAFVSHGTPFAMTISETITLTPNSSDHIEMDANFTPQSVPEPSSLVLAGISALGAIGFRLRRRQALGA
jgi:PEP-CTERM motif